MGGGLPESSSPYLSHACAAEALYVDSAFVTQPRSVLYKDRLNEDLVSLSFAGAGLHALFRLTPAQNRYWSTAFTCRKVLIHIDSSFKNGYLGTGLAIWCFVPSPDAWCAAKSLATTSARPDYAYPD
jgi:hypothetical protein